MLPKPESFHFIEPEKLESFDGIVVDVRTPEAYAEMRIPGTANHCVYQVDFLEKFPEAYPDKGTKIVVYGDGEPYKADLAALGRLQALGYTNVSILEGGLTKWNYVGGAIEGTGPIDVTNESSNVQLELDVERTKIRWIGRNLMSQHNGEISASSGFMELSPGGSPLRGKVTVDLRSMVNHDIEDKGLADMLIGHLASGDFFDVEMYPEASFEIVTSERIVESTYGMPNYSIIGRLSARGFITDLNIEALIEPIEDGYVFQSVFSFDRTQVGAVYGSGRIFERLGMHLVNDMVSMDLAAFFSVSQ